MNKLKMLLFLALFSTLLTVQEATAQRRWIRVDNNIEIDKNVQRLPNGNLKYWARYPSLASQGDFDEILTEINCVTRQHRMLMVKRADSYGNVRVIQSTPDDWKEENRTITSDNNRLVCSSNPREVKAKPNEPFMPPLDAPSSENEIAPTKTNIKKKPAKQSRRPKKRRN